MLDEQQREHTKKKKQSVLVTLQHKIPMHKKLQPSFLTHRTYKPNKNHINSEKSPLSKCYCNKILIKLKKKKKNEPTNSLSNIINININAALISVYIITMDWIL